MKKIATSLILLFGIMLNSFSQIPFYKGQNILMPENLIVKYTVNMKPCIIMDDGICQDTIEKPLVDNKEIQNLFGIIMDGVLKKKIKIYQTDFLHDYTGQLNPMITDDVRDKMEEPSPKIWVEDESGNLIQKTFEIEMDISELFALSFIEDWQLTEKPFSMTKKVVGYSPIRKFYRYGFDGIEARFRLLFLCLDTLSDIEGISKSDKRMELTNRISYEYFLIPEVFNDVNKGISLYKNAIENGDGEGWLYDSNSPYFTNEGKSRFLKLIIRKGLKENYPVYDFDTNKQLTIDEIKNNLDVGVDTIVVEDFENPGKYIDKVIEKELHVTEIKSIIFHEEWYIDPITLRMHKKVIGISPVRYCYQWSSFKQKDILIKKIVFTMYFEGMK